MHKQPLQCLLDEYWVMLEGRGTPEQLLAASVLYRGVCDVVRPYVTAQRWGPTAAEIQKEAKRWIFQRECSKQCVGSFAWWCDVACGELGDGLASRLRAFCRAALTQQSAPGALERLVWPLNSPNAVMFYHRKRDAA